LHGILFYLLKKINPSRNHEFHNRESTEWSGKSQIPQLPIHPMDWKSHEFHNRESTEWSGKSQIPQLPIHPNGLEITKVPRNANVVNPME
jgi:hypothetical protein